MKANEDRLLSYEISDFYISEHDCIKKKVGTLPLFV